MDETTLSLHPPLHKCWMKRGQQKTIPAPGTPQQVHVFGALDWLDETVTWTVADRKNSMAFLDFLEHLLIKQFPTERIVLVLDNASIHKSQISQAALSLFEHRLLIFWLPPYCSTLNLIERFWRHLKDQVCVDTLYPAMEQLIDPVVLELTAQNDQFYPERFTCSK